MKISYDHLISILISTSESTDSESTNKNDDISIEVDKMTIFSTYN